MMVHTTLLVNLIKKQLTPLSNLTIPRKLSKKVPRPIEKRLSRLSSTKEIFENTKNYYEQRLWQCGYNEKLNYTEEDKEINKKSSKYYIRSNHFTVNQ